jgi:hypothetical protein
MISFMQPNLPHKVPPIKKKKVRNEFVFL